jgi:glutathione S-transferase
MSTITSNSTTLLSAAQFVQRADVRVLGDWLADDGTRLTSAQVVASAVLAVLLKGASGELESAVMAGERYTAADLAAVAASGTNSAELLFDVVAGLTLARVWGRRPRTDNSPLPALSQWAQQRVEELRSGLRIFPTTEHAAAGVLSHDEITAEEVRQRGYLTQVGRRFFGRRAIEFAEDC